MHVHFSKHKVMTCPVLAAPKGWRIACAGIGAQAFECSSRGLSVELVHPGGGKVRLLDAETHLGSLFGQLGRQGSALCVMGGIAAGIKSAQWILSEPVQRLDGRALCFCPALQHAGLKALMECWRMSTPCPQHQGKHAVVLGLPRHLP